MMLPLPLEERVASAHAIALAVPVEDHAYIDSSGNIYTRWRMEVKAWLKNPVPDGEFELLTYGGLFGNQAMVVYPALRVRPENEYLLFLREEEWVLDDKELRQLAPNTMQRFAYSDAQGALPFQFNTYRDAYFPQQYSEAEIFQLIAGLTGQPALTPAGEPYTPRPMQPLEEEARLFPITSFGPNPTHSGTIVTSDFLNIDGSGFGGAAGNVWFPNADDGGATLVAASFSSDYLSWSDTHIEVKVLEEAGTGTFLVNSIASPSPLTVHYSHIPIYSNFSGFPEVTRQRYYLRNMNGSGGYTFVYNNTVSGGFFNNTAAVEAFERAVETWRCNTFVNWTPDSIPTSATLANDNLNVVTWDNSLPAGTLGVITARFTAGGNTGCQQFNTVWCLEEVDQAYTPSINWEFGPAMPSLTEVDFESVCLHELGHAHGLGHRIAPGELMHYALDNGVAIRSPGIQETNGANAKMAYSTIPTCFNPGGCGAGPMTPLNAVSCLLPIELLHFTATPAGNTVALEWQTASETNNDFFTLERADHNLHFQAIAQIEGAGLSTAIQTYRWVDTQPLRGESYYRLRQTDFDGQHSFSPLVAVYLPYAEQTLRLAPNPASEFVNLTLQIPSENPEPLEVAVFDLLGKMVIQQKFSVNTGTNQLQLQTGLLPAGLYLLQVRSPDVRLAVRLEKW